MPKMNAAVGLPRFPKHRPRITITPSRAKPFVVDCRELRWWNVIPAVGERAVWAHYAEPGWSLTGAIAGRVLGPAKVHRIEGVEIEVLERMRDDGPNAPWLPLNTKTVFGRITEKTTQWLSVIETWKGVKDVSTFLDKGFDADFGEASRTIEDRGLFVRNADGSFLLKANQSDRLQESYGAGVFDVRVGERKFVCLRAVEPNWGGRPEGCFMEAYLTRQGRTVLHRHYRSPTWALGRDWAKKWTGGKTWDEAFPGHDWIAVNGRRFYHWQDCLTGVALGLK